MMATEDNMREVKRNENHNQLYDLLALLSPRGFNSSDSAESELLT
jgi:hypothetical protein